MTDAVYVLYLGGLLHVGWAVFYALSPRVFKWDQSLSDLAPLHQSAHRVMNLCLVFYFAAAAYLTLAFARQLLATSLGRALMTVLALFWMWRFWLQLRYFKGWHPISLLLSLLFLLSAGAYFYPLWQGGG